MVTIMKRRIILSGLFVLCQIAAGLSAIRFAWAIISNTDRAWRIALAYDRLGNAVANDDEVQTISGRAQVARLAGKRWGCVLCYLLDSIQKDHCVNSARGE